MTIDMEDEKLKYELTPTGLHRHNLAERAIQTFKNHFISRLCSTHPDFPIKLWDKLLPQAEHHASNRTSQPMPNSTVLSNTISLLLPLMA